MFAAPKVSESTARHYQRDFRRFARWCDEAGEQSLPASRACIARFAENERSEGFARATIGRRLAAITRAHRDAGHVVRGDAE